MTRKFALWVPRWLQYLILVVAAGVGPVVAALAKSATGVTWAVIVGAAAAALAAGMKLLGDWQSSEKSRLDVALRVSAPDEGIVRFPINDEFIKREARRLRAGLLSALPKPSTDDRGRQHLDPTGQVLKQLQDQVAKGLSGNYEEDRTPDEYRAEVEEYITDYTSFLTHQALYRFAQTSGAKILFSVGNDTERPLEGVEVTVTVRGDVYAVDPAAAEPGAEPVAPRKWGRRPWGFDLGGSSLSGARAVRMGEQLWSPEIENGEGVARISFQQVALRGHQTVDLTPIVLVAFDDTTETTLEVSWEATAGNAVGVARGSLELQVGGTVASYHELLQDAEQDGPRG